MEKEKDNSQVAICIQVHKFNIGDAFRMIEAKSVICLGRSHFKQGATNSSVWSRCWYKILNLLLSLGICGGEVSSKSDFMHSVSLSCSSCGPMACHLPGHLKWGQGELACPLRPAPPHNTWVMFTDRQMFHLLEVLSQRQHFPTKFLISMENLRLVELQYNFCVAVVGTGSVK